MIVHDCTWCTLLYTTLVTYSSSAYWVRLAKWSVRLSANHSVPRKGLQGNTSSDTRQKRELSFQIAQYATKYMYVCTYIA